MARSRLGWLGPVIVIVGVIGAAGAIAYYLHARPVAGAEVDRVPCPVPGAEDGTLVIRAEQGGPRSFAELHATTPGQGDHVIWQALIPPYAGAKGRPAVACGPTAVTVRVDQSGRAAVFAFTMGEGGKLGTYWLAPEHEPIHTQPTGPITLTDGIRSYELVGGEGWHQIVAVMLATGEGLWKVDLGPEPVTDGGIDHGVVWLRQGAKERRLDAATGRDAPVTSTSR